MSLERARSLIDRLDTLMDIDQEREQARYAPTFLCVLRKQNTILAENLDKKVSIYFPRYDNKEYKMELTEKKNEDFPEFSCEDAELMDDLIVTVSDVQNSISSAFSSPCRLPCGRDPLDKASFGQYNNTVI